MELQAPFVLAQLPRPLGASAGKCQLGKVYGVEGSKKRKRYEVAAAIDGESVNIYNVQFPKLVTSYAVPPQSSFSCPPCSVRQKSSPKQNAVARRHTYCSIEQPENQVQCFLDQSTTGAHNALNVSNTSFKLEDARSPVVFLGIIPTAPEAEKQQDPFDVLVVHKDGRVRRLSPDLKTQKWNILPTTDDKSASHEIQTGFLVAFDDARKSLFKKRQDIVATVLGDEIGAESGTSSVLILVSRPHHKEQLLPSDFDLIVFSLSTQATDDGFSISHAKRLRHLMTISLPNLEEEQTPVDPKSLQWNFHPSTSGLSLSFTNGFIIYDISQYSPEILSYMVFPNENFSSIMRISPQSVIGAGKSSVAIYNARYQSIQADLSLKDISTVIATKSDADKAPVVFISYFSKLGIAIATRGATLLGFDLSSSLDRYDGSLKQSGDGLLINAIGKGIQLASDSVLKTGTKPANHMRPVGLCEPEEAARWAEIKKQLDALAEVKDTANFDKLMKDAVCKPSVSGEDDKPKHLPSAAAFVDPEKISFLLGKIFSLRISDTDPKTSKLVMSFMPPKTFRWLINSHHLSLNNIRTALCQSMRPRMVPPIPNGSLVRALTEPGISIKLLLQVLRTPINLDPTELAHALKVLLDFARSHRPRPEEELPRTITEAAHPAKESSSQEMTTENQIKSSPAHRGIDAIITDATTGLNLTLTKLHFYPIDKVTQAIRSALSNSDTLSIIHHLRHSLATGGYTSRFIEQSEAPLPPDPKIPTLSLSTLVNLLTACIDAIGPSGWISAATFAGATDSEASLIADMKSEISAALVGVEEATYLKGILREFVRYAETAAAGANSNRAGSGNSNKNKKEDQADQAAPALPRGSRLKRKERHNGAEILIYDTDNIDGAEGALNRDTQMLPLSLKRVEVGGGPGQDVVGTSASGEEVSRTKIRKTGEVVARTEREIGYLRAKAVGKYSFERIIV
ncbi:hypothetical protein BDBG_08352 [Blastomyces gilchristii SLH14081]|uniref:Utp8 beta-propeller domain-containing protein n=1 Tax=Blastomyces gilchristii (strain SLH14081) TaxID=559298 RepID=A0A179V397_BLAGS|nr:uncharacterized protein BDBG_08352 [Blastomyces gilchristii SLH14081]OAT13082.1 hypothetical protein BDBG_08352 [Blastomyces gilchristii SLH14081]